MVDPYSISVRITMTNTAASVPLFPRPAQFSLESDQARVFSVDAAEQVRQETGCKSDVGVAVGGTVTCSLFFAMPQTDIPAKLTFTQADAGGPASGGGTSPLVLVATLPEEAYPACTTLEQWKPKTVDDCANCAGFYCNAKVLNECAGCETKAGIITNLSTACTLIKSDACAPCRKDAAALMLCLRFSCSTSCNGG